MIEAVYSLLPSFYKTPVEEEAHYAKIDNYETWVANGLFLTTLASISLSIYFLPLDLPLNAGIGLLAGIVGGLAIPYMLISLRAERRKKKMEDVLADALRLVSSNVRSGHTIEKSFLLSARDEFGPLGEELRTTAMEMYGGIAVEESLTNMESRIKSELFQETLKLLIDGIKAGGDKADLLESSAEDIRSSLEMREEIKSSIRMYVVFITMVAVAGAPILFAVSVHMADVTTDMWDDADLDEMDMGGAGSELGFEMSFEPPNVDVEFFRMFAYMAIITTNVFAALIISEINNGNVKQGFKYAPIFCIASVILFTAVSTGIGWALSGI